MRKPKPYVVGVLCSDVHLSQTAPAVRAEEPNWFQAMERPLKAIKHLCVVHECPLIVAGDLFDRWNSSPELINFAMDWLPPTVFAVPGQHDMPHHSMDGMNRSAYRTLTKSGRVHDLVPGVARSYKVRGSQVVLIGYPWGQPLKAYPRHPDTDVQVAVIHAYCWIKGHNHVGADQQTRAGVHVGKLGKSFDVAVFGDNHQGFILRKKKQPTIVNCGGLMRRSVTDLDRQPCVYLLMSDKTIKPHELNTNGEKYIAWTDKPGTTKGIVDLESLCNQIKSLRTQTDSFRDTVMAATDSLPPRVAKRLKELLEDE